MDAMETDRQEDIESPLIEDFLDCAQLFSDSDGDSTSTGTSPESTPPRRTFKRLHIKVDMASTQYLNPVAHHSHSEPTHIDGLPVCSSGPPSVAYASPVMDLFSAVSGVSSFNPPAAADSTLLTPVSGAGSPPLPQRHQPPKSGRGHYRSQSCAPGAQPPTPPHTSTMYFNGYEVSSGSQSPSAMTVNPSVTEAGHLEMAAYMAHSPPASQHPSSPRNEIGPPVDPYLGHYTVSGGDESELTHHHTIHDYHNQNPYVGVSAPGDDFFGQQQHMPVDSTHMHHQRMPSNGQAPALSHPHPSHFRQHPTPQIGAIEDLRGDPSMFLGTYPSRAALSPGRRQPRKKPSPGRKNSRTPKTTPRIGSDGQTLANGQMRQDEEEEELTLRDDAPEDEKYLFQLRKEFIAEKGKGMWDEMKVKYSEKHQGNWEKAALQMKVSRAVAKYGVWPERELDRLRAAFQYIEEKRYQLILQHMKENGGCRVWDWKTQHLEAMLVKLGLEEQTPDARTGSRRRRHKVARRQASPQNGAHPSHPNVMGDWSNGLGLHPHPHFQGHHHAHHLAAAAANGRRVPPFENMMPDDGTVAPTFTPEQESEFIDQIFDKVGVKAERSLSPDDSNNSMDMNNNGSRRPSTVGQQHSERVARQACEQMIQRQQ